MYPSPQPLSPSPILTLSPLLMSPSPQYNVRQQWRSVDSLLPIETTKFAVHAKTTSCQQSVQSTVCLSSRQHTDNPIRCDPVPAVNTIPITHCYHIIPAIHITMQTPSVRLRSHRHEYSTSPGFRLWLVEASLLRMERSRSLVQHITQRVSAILKIRSESRKCFTIKTTIFHYKVTISTKRTPLTMNNFTMTSVLTSNMRQGFYKLH